MTGSKSGILGKRLWRIPASVIVLVAIKLLIDLLTAANYGLFRDELYFLAWGYVDQPPLVAGLAWLARALFGTSVVGVWHPRHPSAGRSRFGGLTGLLVHELGGRRCGL